MKFKYTVVVTRWFDKVNGNTYHSGEITSNTTGQVFPVDYQYGYGEQYKQSALEVLTNARKIPIAYRGLHRWKYERENNYPIHWICFDVDRKKDMVKL